MLASQSTIRQQILQAAGVSFEAETSLFDEVAARILMQRMSPKSIAQELAVGKALAVAAKHPQKLVIGADQVLEVEGNILGKPENISDARRQLQTLRGKTHQLHSAVCVCKNREIMWHTTDTAVLSMRIFSDEFLETYLLSEADQLATSVGGYKIEGKGLQLFDNIVGDYFTILGLPLLPLLAYFRQTAIIPS